jgi:hypothetical protein
VVTRESAALSAWYGSRPEIRRLWALRDTQGLRVLVHVERALDSNEIHPAWIANRGVWIDELQSRTGGPVRLEHADQPFGDEVATDAPGIIVAVVSWRDPSFSQS